MSYSWGPPEYDLNKMQPGNYVLNADAGSDVGANASGAAAKASSAFQMGGTSVTRGGPADCKYGVAWAARAQTPLGPVTFTSCNSPPK